MPKRQPPANNQPTELWLTPAVITALIALLGTVIAACVSSPALVALINRSRPSPPAVLQLPAEAPVPAPSVAAPSVEIQGPETAEVGAQTFFTIVSSNAVRGVWSIGGFQDAPVTVEPLGSSHQIYVEPNNAGRDGDSFTIVFTVYDAANNSASAQHRFRVVVP